MPDSHRPQPPSRPAEYTCGNCGTKYIAKSGGCPTCASNLGKRGEEELTKKVIDDNDLKKGF